MARTIAAIIIFLSAVIACFNAQAWAGDDVILAEIAALKAKVAEIDQLKLQVAELQKQVGEQQHCHLDLAQTVAEVRRSLISYKPEEETKIKPCGIEITAGATMVLQGTPNANNAGGSEASRFDASWSSDIYIQRAFDDWGKALIHLEPGQGSGLEPELDLYSNVDRDVNDTGANVPVTELWYEQYIFNKQVAVTAGKLDPANYLDQNEYAFDETTQFLARIFRNNPAIEWPNDNTLGARLILAPEALQYLSLEMAYFDADNNWENVFDRPFLSAQLNVKPSKFFGWDPEQWDGNYRFYWWINELDHSKLVDAGEPPADNTKLANTGFGLSCDQMVTDAFGVFGRFGWQRPDLAIASTSPNTAPCEASWSGGFQMTGKYWNREDDVAAIAVGQVFPSRHYKDAGNGGSAEGHFEAYYRMQVNKYLALTPDFQIIWNPRGINHEYQGNVFWGDSDAIFVYGVRGQVDF